MKSTYLFLTVLCLALTCSAIARAEPPVKLIFDTDIGNDVDDVLALAMIHSLQSRGECELLAVTITKDNPNAAAFVDAVNTFYGRGQIPIGVCRGSKKTTDDGKFNVLANVKDDGKYRFAHDLLSGDEAPKAVELLRSILAKAENQSISIAQVGFSTNLAGLLSSEADSISPLSGRELVKQKVKLVSVMAGAFERIKNEKGDLYDHPEYNVAEDIPSAKKLVELCDAPIVWSGFEVGLALAYPHQSIEQDYRYVVHHPVAEAYYAYIPPPHDRPTWDLTSVLYAVRPTRGYFDLSPAGTVRVADNALTTFAESAGGKHRFLKLTPAMREKSLEALVQLSSQPPCK